LRLQRSRDLEALDNIAQRRRFNDKEFGHEKPTDRIWNPPAGALRFMDFPVGNQMPNPQRGAGLWLWHAAARSMRKQATAIAAGLFQSPQFEAQPLPVPPRDDEGSRSRWHAAGRPTISGIASPRPSSQ
jgi:hypothetical protein